MKSFLLASFCILYSFCALAASTERIVSIETDAGTLEGSMLETDEENPRVIALIIAGSGPTDRDGNNSKMTNNSLKMLATDLSKKGVSSLRYDKRMVGKSKFSGMKESDMRFEHYIDDANSWVEYLSDSGSFERLVVIGHSEGSLVGMVVSQNENVDKFISIAGAGRPVDQILRAQLEAHPAIVLEQSSEILDELLQGKTVKNIPEYLNALFRPSVQPYMISWFKYDPQKEISKLSKPVLIVQGSTDIQVGISDADQLASANAKAEKVVIRNMNHIFKDAPLDRKINLQSYNDPNLEIKRELVRVISDFILK